MTEEFYPIKRYSGNGFDTAVEIIVLNRIELEQIYEQFKSRLAAEATMNLWLMDGEKKI